MATIISFYNQKGGVGKSLLTHLMAKTLGSVKKEILGVIKIPKVLVIDMDPQLSLATAYAAASAEQERMPYDIKTINFAKGEKKNGNKQELLNIEELTLLMADNLSTANDDYDYIFIDMPGIFYLENIQYVLKFVEVIFIPFKGGGYDLQSSQKLLEWLNFFNYNNPKFKINFYLYASLVKQKTLALKNIIANFENLDLPYLENPFYDFTLYSEHAYNFNNILPIVNGEIKTKGLKNPELTFYKIYKELDAILTSND